MPKSRSSTEVSAATRRTRGLIIEAAITLLAARPTATLAEIADAADISRSTLHRHFTDRDDLLAALDAECRIRFGQAAEAARLGEGSALEALDRLAQEYLGMGLVLGLVFADNAPVDPDSWGHDQHDGGLAEITRGRHDGDLDPTLSAEWMLTTFWTLLFAAWLSLQDGMSRRDVAFQLSRTLHKAFGTASH